MKHLLPLFALLVPTIALGQEPPPEPVPEALYPCVGKTIGAITGGSISPKYPDYWANHKDPLVRDLVAILHETRSSDSFLMALVLLQKREVDRERLIPVILRNAERVGLLGDALVNNSEGSSRKQIVHDLQTLLVEMAEGKQKAAQSTPPQYAPPTSPPAPSRYVPPAPPSTTPPLPQKPPPPPAVQPITHQKGPRTPIKPPIAEGAPVPGCEDPPGDDEVLRALPRIHRIPHVYEESRDDVQIVKELIVDKVDPPRFFPPVGAARLHHCHWKCTVYFTETIKAKFPFPFRCVRRRTEVVYIDQDHLHLAAAADGGKGECK